MAIECLVFVVQGMISRASHVSDIAKQYIRARDDIPDTIECQEVNGSIIDLSIGWCASLLVDTVQSAKGLAADADRLLR